MSRNFKQRRSRRLDLDILRENALHEMQKENTEAEGILDLQIKTLDQQGLDKVISQTFNNDQEVS